jgi:hypothetical protein
LAARTLPLLSREQGPIAIQAKTRGKEVDSQGKTRADT